MKKRKINRILALLLAFVIMIPATAFADSKDTHPVKCSAKYLSTYDDDADVENTVEFYFDDSYFTDSEQYNAHLATASLALSMSAGNAQSTNVENALKGIGCDVVTPKGYGLKSENGIGVTLGRKTLSNGNILIPVVVRGSRYDDEWVANFNLGQSGDAAGFRGPADQINEEIAAFVQTNTKASDNIVLWITGYSRGAAIANLVAADMTGKFQKENVFGYCFEGPRAAFPGNSSMKNIHAVNNENDGVTVVFPQYMGAGINGNVDNVIGTGNESDMIEMMKKITDKSSSFVSPSTFQWSKMTINVDPAQMKLSGGIADVVTLLYLNSLKTKVEDNTIITKKEGKVGSQADFWKAFTNRAEKVIPDRASYYALQPYFMDLMRFINSTDASITTILKDSIKGSLTTLLTTTETNQIISQVLSDVQNGRTLSVTDAQCETLANAIYENGIKNTAGLSDDQKQYIKSAMTGLLKPALQYLTYDYNASDQTLGTLLAEGNIGRLAQAHYFEVNMAWLMMQDSYFNSDDSFVPAHSVTYSYKSTPSGASALPAKRSYLEGETVELAAPAKCRGYLFNGWAINGKIVKSFVMPNADVTAVGSWTKVVSPAITIKTPKRAKKAFTAKWKANTSVKGYRIQYSTNKKFKKSNKYVTVSGAKSTSKKISKLKKKKTYYVRVQSYKLDSTGSPVYSKWSKTKKVKTK